MKVTNQICFIIQKKGDLFKNIYLKSKSLDEKKYMLSQLVAFYKKIELKGLSIWDNAITRNIGWQDNAPFLMDTGAVCRKSSGEPFDQSIQRLTGWIERNDPEQKEFFLALIAGQ